MVPMRTVLVLSLVQVIMKRLMAANLCILSLLKASQFLLVKELMHLIFDRTM